MRKYEMTAEELAAFLRRFDGAEKFIPAFLALAKRYDDTDRSTIIGNVDLVFEPYMSNIRQRYGNKHGIVMAITGVTRSTVEAWFTEKRDIKMPLVHLSKIADRLNIPLENFLGNDGSWFNDSERERVKHELWSIEDQILDKENDTMRECYGYELAGTKSGKHKLVVYKTIEAARRDAEDLSKKLEDDETLILFSAPADEEGKLASNQFKILDAWGKN